MSFTTESLSITSEAVPDNELLRLFCQVRSFWSHVAGRTSHVSDVRVRLCILSCRTSHVSDVCVRLCILSAQAASSPVHVPMPHATGGKESFVEAPNEGSLYWLNDPAGNHVCVCVQTCICRHTYISV